MDDDDTPTGEQVPNGKDALRSMDDRLRKLEQTKAFIGGGAIVGAVLILGFLGFTSFHQIPQAVRSSVSTAVEEYVEKQIPQFAEKLNEHRQNAENASKAATISAEKTHQILAQLQDRGELLRVESGDIDLDHSNDPDLRRTNECPSVRGHVGRRIEFSTPFNKPPKVVLSLNLLDHVMGQNLRIRADVAGIDIHGFNSLLSG